MGLAPPRFFAETPTVHLIFEVPDNHLGSVASTERWLPLLAEPVNNCREDYYVLLRTVKEKDHATFVRAESR